jgi:aerobic-type carbon monoxide dehydrogenase small subunit (CoxS/CutS family)
MDGHLCRCGGYPRVMKAIQLAGKVMGGKVLRGEAR